MPAGNPMDVLSASASQGLRWHQPFCAVRFLWHPAHQGGANPAFSPLWPPARRFRERGPNKRGQLPVRPRAVGWVGEGSASLRAHPPRANRHRRTPLFAEPTTPAGPQKPLGEAFAQRGQRAGGRARSAAQRGLPGEDCTRGVVPNPKPRALPSRAPRRTDYIFFLIYSKFSKFTQAAPFYYYFQI